jgi:hypothetical protein
MRLAPILLSLLAAAAPAAAAEPPRRAAFFGVHFVDTSDGGDLADEMARVAMVEGRLREALEGSGRYAFVDVAPVAKKAGLYENIAQCNGCDARLAEELGADVALTAEVQKTSNLILHMTVYLREAGTGTLVGGGSADIRGNTDETWMRAVDYILKNRVLKD